MGDQEYNIGKKYRQKGTLCGPNNLHFPFYSILVLGCFIHVYSIYLIPDSCHPISVLIIGIASIFSLL